MPVTCILEMFEVFLKCLVCMNFVAISRFHSNRPAKLSLDN